VVQPLRPSQLTSIASSGGASDACAEIKVIAKREAYALERAALEARWAARTESHLRFRATMRLIDLSFRELKRIGYF
jgi:hypothetical protein